MARRPEDFNSPFNAFPTETIVMILKDLLDDARPALRRLKIILPERGTRLGASIAINCPSLRWLHVSGTQVSCETPFQELATLELHGLYSRASEVEWSTLCGPILTLCPAVEFVSITFSGDFAITGPKYALPRVKTLSLHSGESTRSMLPYQSLLDRLDLPNLEKLRIKILQPESLSNILRALPNSVSHLHILSVAKSDFVNLPRKVVESLLSGSNNMNLMPGLTCLGCFISALTPKVKLGQQEVRELTTQPEFTDLEKGLTTLLGERKLIRINLPVTSQAFIELGGQHNVKVKVRRTAWSEDNDLDVFASSCPIFQWWWDNKGRGIARVSIRCMKTSQVESPKIG
ncbi:hypothetical protein DL93DRAFT_2158845 [Clavulina sp. PMI_390]|nr:hypothetical protein DL93DRAFT_2158845 [Clavulina sp. PMI_390]